MSRSFEKVANWNDGISEVKKQHHKRFRRGNKVRVQKGEEPLLDEEFTNSYDIRDYSFNDWKNREEYQKYKRK